jgi:uncharacterized pyridoxamine 5'-phosphate oxidase family protein
MKAPPNEDTARGGGIMRKWITVALCALAVIVALFAPATGDHCSTGEGGKKADTVTGASGSLGKGGADSMNMEDVLAFAQKNQMGYLATVEGGKPKVRAFTILKVQGDTLYFSTNNKGATYPQLRKAPFIEWIAMDPQTYTTLRISGKVVFVEDMDVKRQAIKANPMLTSMYSGDAETEFEMFYIVDLEPNWFGMWEMPDALKEEAEE